MVIKLKETFDLSIIYKEIQYLLFLIITINRD